MSDSVVSRESAMELIHLRRSIRNYTESRIVAMSFCEPRS